MHASAFLSDGIDSKISNGPDDTLMPLSDYPLYRDSKIVRGASGLFCRMCRKMISHRGDVKRHFMDRHMVRDVVYSCPGCAKCFTAKNSFTSHVYRNHPQFKGINFMEFATKLG